MGKIAEIICFNLTGKDKDCINANYKYICEVECFVRKAEAEILKEIEKCRVPFNRNGEDEYFLNSNDAIDCVIKKLKGE